MIHDESDAVCDFLARVRIAMPEMTDDVAHQIEVEFRLDWGGDRI